MIQIALRDKLDLVPMVVEHPKFVDFEFRNSDDRTLDAVVEIAVDNTVAPVVKSLDGMVCSHAYPIVSERLTDLLSARPSAQDGQMVLALLLTWTQRHPDARVRVSGADELAAYTGFLDPYLPRFSRGFTADGLREVPISDAERMEDVAVDDPRGALVSQTYRFDDSNQDISGPALLQNPNRPRGKSSSSKGRSRDKKKKMTIEDRNTRTDLSLQDDGRNAREVLTQRVSAEAKRTYDDMLPPEKRKIFEAVANLRRAGRSTDDLIAAMERGAA